MKRHITVFALSAALTLAPLAAIAADSQPAPEATLAPGPAAGVQNAEGMTDTTYAWIVGGAAVAAVIIIVASGGGHHGVSATTTGTSP